jgi:alpha,alpha-trehalase
VAAAAATGTATMSLACTLPTDTLTRLRLHISETWPHLTRSLRRALDAAIDPKTTPLHGHGPALLYISMDESAEAIQRQVDAMELDQSRGRQVEVRRLEVPPEMIAEHGLLFLPGRYVVPGGRFNELYGWDSYFMALGLLRDGRDGLAQSVADQLLYEVAHYGAVLNCNRTYCLTRSHPPFLGRLVLAVFEELPDFAWLRAALPLVERYHAYWMSPPQFMASIGLSRYHALGQGPAPEVLGGERDADGRSHYERVCEALRDDPSPPSWIGEVYDRASHALTGAGYVNDRTVRESGFDLTHRFGLCGLDSRSYVPVCLNTLLWRLESDIALMRTHLGAAPESIAHWQGLADARQRRMNELLWDEEDGMFYDWNLRDGARSRYPFATTFWPLWAGWASPEQAARVAGRLPDFLARGGLLTSAQTTGCQWDAPFTWAPLVHMAVGGLDAYGFTTQARDLARRFVTLAACEFDRTGHLYEKYDAVAATSDVDGKLRFGYPTNEIGFGWTNAVVSELLAWLGWPESTAGGDTRAPI